MTSKSRVFLSYAFSDKAFAFDLMRALERLGADTFDPHRDIKPGNAMWTVLSDGLKKSDLMVFVVPRFEGQGKSALVELGAAKALGKRIVAILPDQMRAANNDVVNALSSTHTLQAAGKDIGLLASQVLAEKAAA